MTQAKTLGPEQDRPRRARRSLPVEEPGDAGPGAGRTGTSGPADDQDGDPPMDDQWHPSFRESLRDRARAFFGETVREKIRDYERLAAADRQRAETENEQADVRDQLLKLRAESRAANDAYMTSLRDSRLSVPGYTDEERDEKLDAMHEVHTRMMMQACLKPLSRGVNASSVIQAVGMMTAMQLMSKDLRQETATYLQPIRDKIQERIDVRTLGKVTSADKNSAVFQRHFGEGTPDAVQERLMRSADPRDHLTAKWRKRLDDLEYRQRGNRAMFTPESAALTEVGLMENAFWKMREPGADTDQIDASYRAMRKRLNSQIAEDGLDRGEVTKRSRMIIGERLEHEPELRTMVNGLAHGRIVKAAPHKERLAGTDRVREVWTGEFDDQYGKPVPDAGMFTLRPLMDADQHQAQLGKTMGKTLIDSLDRGDEDVFRTNVQGYVVGFTARQQGRRTDDVPQPLRQRLEESEVMIASMDIDGLSPEEQRRVYSNACTDALDEVLLRHPELDLGPQWRQEVQQAVDDPEGFYEQNRFRTRGNPGPSSDSRTGSPPDAEAPHAGADSNDFQPA